MQDANFGWDDIKAAENVINHGVTFDEARACFTDPCGAGLLDDAHSDAHEVRFDLIAFSAKARLLYVVYTMRNPRIHIISARRATRNESQFYEEHC